MSLTLTFAAVERTTIASVLPAARTIPSSISIACPGTTTRRNWLALSRKCMLQLVGQVVKHVEGCLGPLTHLQFASRKGVLNKNA